MGRAVMVALPGLSEAGSQIFHRRFVHLSIADLKSPSFDFFVNGAQPKGRKRQRSRPARLA